MKKLVAITALLALGSLAFAQDLKLSAGAGLGFSSISNTQNVPDFMEVTFSGPALSFGAFFDATYVTVGVDYTTSIGKSTAKGTAYFPSEAEIDQDYDSSFAALDLTLNAKYPFAVAEGISLFPVVGITYSLNTAYTDNEMDTTKDDLEDDAKADLNDLFLNLGLGADIDVATGIYIRPSFMVGINLDSAQTQYKDIADLLGSDYTSSGLKIGGGVAVGFKL